MKTVGIIGINGMVGQKMLAELKKIKTPFALKTFGRSDEITPLDIAILCTDNPVSKELAPQIKDRVQYTVDMSSEFRMTPGVPLVIPEINPQDITAATRLIASPNCTTTGLVMSLAPLKPFYHFEEVYQRRFSHLILEQNQILFSQSTYYNFLFFVLCLFSLLLLLRCQNLLSFLHKIAFSYSLQPQ